MRQQAYFCPLCVTTYGTIDKRVVNRQVKYCLQHQYLATRDPRKKESLRKRIGNLR